MSTSTAIENRQSQSRIADTFARSVGWVVLLMVLQRGIGFARSFYVCDVLSPSEVGLWDLSFSFLMTLAPLAVLGIPGSFGRYIARFETQGGLARFHAQALASSVGLSLLAAVGIAVAREPLAAWVLGDVGHADLMLMLAAGLPILVLFNFSLSWYSGRRLNRLVFRIQFTQCLTFALLCVLAMTAWEASGRAVVAAYLVSALFGMLLAAGYASPPGATDRDGQQADHVWRKILPFAFWVWTSNALVNLFAVCDRFLIVNWIAESEVQVQALVGQYHSSRILPLLLVTLGATLGSMATPYLSRDWEQGNREQVIQRLNTLLKSIGLMCCAAAVAARFVAPVLFQGLWDGKFAMGESLLPLTLAYCGLAAMSLVAQKYFWVLERTWLSSLALVTGIAVNLGFGIALARGFGVQGVVAATWLAHVSVFTLVLLLCRQSGWRVSPGVILVAIVLAASAWSGWIMLLGTVALGGMVIGTDWIFDVQEKQQMKELMGRLIARIGGTQR